MVQRLVGAVVAIAAAALLVAGAVTSAWWVGETTSGGAQTVAIGLRSEQVCHLEHTASGKPRCTATTTTDCDSSVGLSCRTRGTLDHEAIFGAAGWLATVMGALAALLLAAATASLLRGRDGGRGAVNAGGIVGAIGGIGALVFIVMRPSMSGVDGALAWPAYAFLGGAAASVLASIIVRFEPSERPVHDRVPRARPRVDEALGAGFDPAPKPAPPAMSFDIATMFAEEEPGTKTDPSQGPPEMALAPAVRVVSEPRADTEKDLPPEGMQRAVPPAPPPVRPKPASLPPLPLPRTKPPSLPPPFKPPSTPAGTGPAPRIAAPDVKAAPPPPATGLSAAGPVPACSQCDAPTVWNEEHLRFYCRKCRIYL